MPGRLMTAQQAAKEYGKGCKAIKKHGNEVIFRNPQGKKQTVSKNTEIYHRGHCKFERYSESDDRVRGHGVGTGNRRHTHDRKR